MCNKNDLPLSLKSDTFNALCSDFDQVLRATLHGMDETSQDVAEVNVKVKITLTPDSAPDFSVRGVSQQTRSITKPKFDHTVTAVIQRKEKKTGTLAGNYELVWDKETCTYVMRPIDDGQTSIFDGESGGNDHLADTRGLPASGGGVIDAEYSEVEDDPAGDSAEGTGGDREAYNWLRQFIDCEMKVLESMGNYTVRTADNKVILSSAANPDMPFYVNAEVLAPHVGHSLTCTEGPNTVVIMCEDCEEVIYRMEDPDAADDGEEGHQEGAEEVGDLLDHPGDGDYPYEEDGDPYGSPEGGEDEE